jgi:uridine kinase
VAGIVALLQPRHHRTETLTVVAVDGGAGAGKTTLAALLHAEVADSAVLHTDDLLAGWDDQFTFWPRLHAALDTIAAGRPARWPGYDWEAHRHEGEIVVPVRPVLIVEGVSAIAACGARASLRVFCDLPRAQRERRWAQRDGRAIQEQWRRWLDAEDVFFACHPPAADVIVRGG